MRRVVLLAAVLAIALPTAAHAVWGGQPDTAHPGVGAIYSDFSGNGTIEADELICSGSYAGRSKSGANDVFLTAGHCLPPAELGIPAGDSSSRSTATAATASRGRSRSAPTIRCRASGTTPATCTTSGSCSCPRARFPRARPRYSCRGPGTSTS